MYSNKCCMPANNIRYTNYQSQPYNQNGERFFWGPFLVGGLAGTALGYGLSNNKGYYPGPVYYAPPYQQMYPPMYTTNYYY